MQIICFIFSYYFSGSHEAHRRRNGFASFSNFMAVDFVTENNRLDSKIFNALIKNDSLELWYLRDYLSLQTLRHGLSYCLQKIVWCFCKRFVYLFVFSELISRTVKRTSYHASLSRINCGVKYQSGMSEWPVTVLFWNQNVRFIIKKEWNVWQFNETSTKALHVSNEYVRYSITIIKCHENWLKSSFQC